MWHPRITRGLRAVADVGGPRDPAMGLLTATGSVLTERHRVDLMAELHSYLVHGPPDPLQGGDTRAALADLLKLLPTAPLGVCFNE